MKPLLLVFALVLAGCIFHVPFADKTAAPIDRDFLGNWIEKTEDRKPSQQLLVLPFSESEYLIHYPADDKGLYYRGYPLELAGTTYVQLQVLGSAKGSPDADKPRFTLARAVVDGDQLSIRMIRNDALDSSIRDSAALRQAFVTHPDRDSLFDKDAGIFLRAR